MNSVGARLTAVGSILAAAFVFAAPASASTVCAPSGCDFTTIQAAVNAASPGDTINVGPGEYDEDVTVNKQVTIIGSGTDANPAVGSTVKGPIGPGPGGSTFQVTAGGVVIDGFRITRAGNNP